MIVVPNADFSALGLGRVPIADAEIALANIDEELLFWLSPDTDWLNAAGLPRDRAGATSWTQVGTLAVTAGVNDQPVWNAPGAGLHVLRSVGNVLPAANWSLSAMAKPAAGGSSRFLVGSQGASYFGLQRNSNNDIVVYNAGGAVITYATEWVNEAAHVMVTYEYDTKALKLFVDGVQRGSATLAAHPSLSTLEIGNVNGSGAPWSGAVGDVLLVGLDLSDGDNAAHKDVVDAYYRWKYATP